jgi:hypothetical protein
MSLSLNAWGNPVPTVDALADVSNPLAGMIVLKTTTSTLHYYDGSTWRQLVI